MTTVPRRRIRIIFASPMAEALPTWWSNESAVLGSQHKSIPLLQVPDDKATSPASPSWGLFRSFSGRLFGKEKAPVMAKADKGAFPSWWADAISATPTTQEALNNMRSTSDPSAARDTSRGATMAKSEDGLPSWWTQKQMALVAVADGDPLSKHGLGKYGAKAGAASGGCCIVS